MTTTTKSPPKSVHKDSIALAKDELLSTGLAKEEILRDIDLRHVGIDLTPGNLSLSESERDFFADRMDADNTFAICRVLEKLKAIREAREKLVALPAAKAAADAATVAYDDAVPKLLEQQREIEARIDTLTTARDTAQTDVERLDSLWNWLRSNAPQHLVDAVSTEIHRVQRTNPTWQEIVKLRDEIHGLLGEPSGAEKLPALRARESHLMVEWKAYIAPIEARLDRWCRGESE